MTNEHNESTCMYGGGHVGKNAQRFKARELRTLRNLFMLASLLIFAGCTDDSSSKSNAIVLVPEDTADLCADGLDNDNNGIKDCDEESCKGFDNCKSSEKQCPANMPEGKKECTCDKTTGTWINCQEGDKQCPANMPEGKKNCTCDKTTGTWINCQDLGPDDKECPALMPEGKKDCTCDYTTGEWKECQEDIKTEICDNDIDDDGDDKADCADEDCAEAENCKSSVTCPDIEPFCAASTYAYCESTELKQERCEFGCGDKKCNSCEEANGEGTCEDNGTFSMRSYCSDNALVTEECPLGCEDSHCLACVEGAQRCSADGISLETCNGLPKNAPKAARMTSVLDALSLAPNA